MVPVYIIFRYVGQYPGIDEYISSTDYLHHPGSVRIDGTVESVSSTPVIFENFFSQKLVTIVAPISIS